MMRLLVLFALSVVASLCSFLGEARADILRGYLINPEMRYERSSTQELVNRNPRSYSLSYQRNRWSALLEYSQYDENSVDGTYSVKRTHQEMMLWARFHAFAWNFNEGRQSLQAYVGMGGGGFKEHIETTFMSETRTDSGNLKFVTGFALGAEYSVRIDERFLFVVGAEGRPLISQDLDPNPMWSAIVRLGFGIFL